jgi:[ribosomal protein S5]-alanine N-acetyltransferase
VKENATIPIQLKTCVIRPWTAHDATSLQRYANNRKIWQNLRNIFPHPYTLQDAETFLQLVAEERPLTTFAIANPSEAIGCIGLRLGCDVHRKTAELGYWLGEPFWNQGIMSEAVVAFSDWAFIALDLVRIHAQSFESNHASARLLQKAGFLREARLRANILKDGKVLDSFLFARTLGA